MRDAWSSAGRFRARGAAASLAGVAVSLAGAVFFRRVASFSGAVPFAREAAVLAGAAQAFFFPFFLRDAATRTAALITNSVSAPSTAPEARLAKRNALPVLFELLLGDPQAPRARQRSQHFFERVPAQIEVRADLLVQPAGGPRAGIAQGRQRPRSRGAFGLGRGTELLRDAPFGRAEIADAAGTARVGQVPEVAHQRRHAALVALGVAYRQVDLRALLLEHLHV